MTSSIKMASNALVLLGDEPLSSFDDATAGATIANQLYETSYLAILSNFRWRFATKTIQLSRLSTKQDSIYSFAFQLPSDLLYLIKVDNSSKYEIYGNELHSNHNTIIIDYIYRVDETNLPPYFIKMFEFYLAMQFSIPLTGDIEKSNFYRLAYEVEMKRARFSDSTQRPSDAITASNRYTKVRY